MQYDNYFIKSLLKPTGRDVAESELSLFTDASQEQHYTHYRTRLGIVKGQTIPKQATGYFSTF